MNGNIVHDSNRNSFRATIGALIIACLAVGLYWSSRDTEVNNPPEPQIVGSNGAVAESIEPPELAESSGEVDSAR